jgi:CopG family nickel-responsive transcriptional regulator
MTEPLRRFSVSMAAGLVDRLDELTRARGYASRSQALADFVRAQLVDSCAEHGDREIAGSLTLVYDHHQRSVQRVLTRIQHDHGDRIVAALHVHLDHDRCMEVLAVRGPAGEVGRLADRLIATKGVRHGRLAITTAGGDL